MVCNTVLLLSCAVGMEDIEELAVRTAANQSPINLRCGTKTESERSVRRPQGPVLTYHIPNITFSRVFLFCGVPARRGQTCFYFYIRTVRYISSGGLGASVAWSQRVQPQRALVPSPRPLLANKNSPDSSVTDHLRSKTQFRVSWLFSTHSSLMNYSLY